MKKSFITDINEINKNINEAEKILKEAMNFCEDDSIETSNFDDETNDSDFDTEDEDNFEETLPSENNNTIESYIDHIRKYSLNGLSALCDTPESEEYQMLKKIFQMCDKKPERKDGLNESHRLFGILKENKKVLFETYINNTKNFNNLKNTLVTEALSKGFNPSDIRLISENKIIR